MNQPEADKELRPIPMINGLDCPACGHPCLMLGDGGYVTCAYIDCPNPDFAEALLQYMDRVRIDELNGVLKAGRFPVSTISTEMFGIRANKYIHDRIKQLQASTSEGSDENN